MILPRRSVQRLHIVSTGRRDQNHVADEATVRFLLSPLSLSLSLSLSLFLETAERGAAIFARRAIIKLALISRSHLMS